MRGASDTSNDVTINTNGEVIRFKQDGKVGIGTATPDAHKLTVVGGDDAEGTVHFHQNVATNNPTLYIQQVGEGGNAGNTTGLLIKCDGQNGGLSHLIRAIGTNSNVNSGTDVDAFVVRNDGKVGIGTTSPISLLDVFFTSSRRLLANYDDSLITLKASNNSSNPENLRLVADDIIFNTGTSGSGSERMRITDAGKVGIGTATPLTKTHIRTAGAAIAGGNAIKSSTMKGLSITNSTNDTSSVGIWFGTSESHWAGISAQRESTSTWGTDLRFYTHEDNTQNLTYTSERMRIDPHGNVGIGQTNPGAELVVQNGQVWVGTGATKGYDFHDFGTGWGYKGLTSPSRLGIFTDANERITVLQGGSVGIGTDAPAQLLHVHKASGDAAAKISCSGHARLILATTGTTDHASVDFGDSGGDVRGRILYANTGDYMKFETNGSERMRVTSDGTLDLISAKFKINGSAGSSGPTLTTDGSGNISWSSAGSGTISGSGTDNYVPRFNGTSALQNSAIFSNDSGSVGIGTNAPDMPLVVKTTAAIQTMKLNGHHTGYGSSLQFDATDAGGLNFELVSGGSGTGGSMNSKFSIRDVANNAPRLTIDSVGNVGIGIATPSERLHIAESTSGSASIRITNSTTGTGSSSGLRVSLEADENTTIMNHSNTNLNLGVNGLNVISIKDAKVGIGTTAPSSKLTVVGGQVEVKGSNDTSALTGMLVKTSSSSSQGLFMVEGSGTGSLTGSIARATMLSSTASGTALQLGSAGVIRATIASNGNFWYRDYFAFCKIRGQRRHYHYQKQRSHKVTSLFWE